MNETIKNGTKTLALVVAVLIGYAGAQTGAAPAAQTAAPAAKEAATPPANGPITISGNGPRPLQQALGALRLKYNGAVSYEEPQYLSPKAMIEDPHIKGTFIPASKPFSVEIAPVQSATDSAGAEKSLQLIVDAYNRSGNPGQFEIRNTEGKVIPVVGVASIDDKGSFVPQKPLLDSPVTIPARERTISDTVDLLCQKLSDGTHVPISVGISPRSLVDHTNVNLGGDKTPARSILAQALAASTAPLYWQLVYDPNSKGYVLNIHSVHIAKPAAPAVPSKPHNSDTHPSIPGQ
jgi:hypothetical protein